STSFTAKDPGVRSGTSSAGYPLKALTTSQLEYFNVAKTEFTDAEGIADGLGPRMNLDSCGGCHAFPNIGGTSPYKNPQVAFANSRNTLPAFITATGPV